MLTLTDWYLIQLSDIVAIGRTANGWQVQTDKVLGIKDEWLVTTSKVYKLNDPDTVWLSTPRAYELFSELEM